MRPLPVDRPAVIRVLLLTAAGLTVAHGLHAFGVGGDGLDWFFNDVAYSAVMVAAAVACVVRAVTVPAERGAWIAIALGVSLWAGGELYWMAHLSNLDEIPYPSLADPLYLGIYPCVYVGIVLLLRARVTRLPASVWLDGGIAALGTAAVGAALLSPVLRDSTGGDTATVAVGLSYPLGDLLLLTFIIFAVALTGWRPDRAWLLMAGGLLSLGVADVVYLKAELTGGYVEGGWMDTAWLVGALLLSRAAWESPPRPHSADPHGFRLMILPCAFAVIALGLVATGSFEHQKDLSMGLAIATLLVVIVRLVMSYGENVRLVAEVRRASQAKSQFLANMSHELRTPLTVIIGFAEVLRAEAPMDADERARHARRILASARHLQTLIDDLLQLTEAEPARVGHRAAADRSPAIATLMADERQPI